MREISTTGSLLDIQFGQDIYVGDDVYIVEEIRKGGMALVALLARRNVNPDKLSYWLPRNIAVKVPLKRANFLASELKKWSLMFHGNIAQLNEILISKKDGFVAVSERCEGSLREIVKSKVIFREDEAYQVIRSCAEALSYAYSSHSVLHLDVKPENILFGKRKFVSGVAKSPMTFDRNFILAASFLVTDWGISSSKLNSLGSKYEDKWLETNNNGGTIPYMAPERYLEGWRSSPASDIFSLAMMWLELLSGRLPFNLASDIPHQILSGEYYSTATDMLNKAPIRPKVRNVILDFITPNPNKRTHNWEQAMKRIRPSFLESLFA